MEKNVADYYSFRNVYRRHRRVWNNLGCFILIVVAIVAYGVYETWFGDPYKPLIPGYVVSKIVVGLVVGWVLTVLAQRK